MAEKEKYRPPINHVPDKTILRHVLQENGALKAENDELRDALERKEKAIAAFKEWQSKVAEHNFKFWLGRGAELMKERPSEDLLCALRQFLAHYQSVKKKTEELEKQLNQLQGLIINMEKWSQALSTELSKYVNGENTTDSTDDTD